MKEGIDEHDQKDCNHKAVFGPAARGGRNMHAVLKSVLVLAVLVAGCTQPSGSQMVEVRPSVYLTDGMSTLQLPTSGYDLYVVGEDHGMRESHLLTLYYLEILYQDAGLRHVAVEGPQYYERMANSYVLGISEKFSTINDKTDVYWSYLLDGIREFNEFFPEDSKVQVHMIDIDSPLSVAHLHLKDISEEIGAVHIEIPSLEELQRWSPEDVKSLINQLSEAARNQDSLKNELRTIMSSFDFHFAENRIGIGVPNVVLNVEGCFIREQAIAQNIQYLVQKTCNGPVLVQCGAWHAQKHQSMTAYSEVNPWVQQLTGQKMSIFSLYTMGIKGNIWHSVLGRKSYYRSPDEIEFADGTTLSVLLEEAPEYDICYIDLRWYANRFIKIRYILKDAPAGRAYDALLIFRTVTPLVGE